MKYIGIDIGDGESAVAQLSDMGAMIPQVVMLGHEKSLLSVVGEAGGEPVVGDSVLTNAAVSERRARFKSRFLKDPAASDALRRFAQGLRSLIAKTSTALNGSADDIRVALGCPAGWTKEDRQKYAAVVMSAGFPNLYTVAESRAAFLYAHYDKELSLSLDSLKKPTLVIDIGSSTTDFAYIVDGKETNVGVFGEKYLGGGFLDRIILDDAVAASPKRSEIESVFGDAPSWRSYCELQARRVKEAYFNGEAHGVKTPCQGSVGIFADINRPLSLNFRLDAERMRKLLETPLDELEGDTFLNAVRDALSKTKDLTISHPPRLLILTGGASRMRFFQEACRARFPEASFILCPEPEFTIARGLSIAARTDYQLARFRAEIEAYFAGDTIAVETNKAVAKLLPELISQLADRVLEEGVLPVVELVAQGKIFDAAQFKSAVEDNTRRVFEEHGNAPQTDALIRDWAAENLTRVQKEIDEICGRYEVDPADLRLADVHVPLALKNIELPLLFRLLMRIPELFSSEHTGKFMRDMANISLKSPKNRQKLRARINAELKKEQDFSHYLSSTLACDLKEQLKAHMLDAEIMIR